jgi:F-type H+-transporting ATPase subunit b
MHIDFWTLGLQAINVLILVWLLARFLFRPVAVIVAQRRQATEAVLAEADATRAKAQAEVAGIAQQRAGLAAEAAALRAAAHKDAETDRATQVAQARAEVERVQADATAALARERAQSEAALQAHACTLAVDIARRLLVRLPQAAITQAFARKLAEDIAALPEAERQDLSLTPDQLDVVTTTPLDTTEQATIRAALTGALGIPVAPIFNIDATLLAGIELRGAHTRIRTTWRSDLDRIADQLAAERADAA